MPFNPYIYNDLLFFKEALLNGHHLVLIHVTPIDDDREFIIGYLEQADGINFCGYYENCEQALTDLDNYLLNVKIIMFTKYEGEKYRFDTLQNGTYGDH